MKEPKIEASDVIRVLLPAHKIPEGATVTKRSGDKLYTLRRELLLYTNEGKNVLASGCFLCDNVGNANQVDSELELHWVLTTNELLEKLQYDWGENDEQ